ncbi:MAG TPA: hypothetical protein VL053_00385 [Arachidicoccus sp.]|nr:hypothetical protein [Arachidicoccus sp.]
MRQSIRLFFIFLIFCVVRVDAQPDQAFGVRYTIYASINDTSHLLTGFEKIKLINQSETAFSSIVLKLYPNAYSSDQTALSDYLLKKGRLDFYFSDTDRRAKLSAFHFSDGQNTLDWTPAGPTNELIRVKLSKVLHPGDSIEIQTPYLLKLPFDFNGFGYRDHLWKLQKWYPEVAAWIPGQGWDTTSMEGNWDLPALKADYYVSFITDGQAQIYTNGRRVPVASNVQQYDQSDGRQQQTQQFERSNSTGLDAVITNKNFVASEPAAVSTESETRQDPALMTPDELTHWLRAGSVRKDSAAPIFDKLLPGPLKGKRPDHPDILLQQVHKAQLGSNNSSTKPIKAAFLFNLKSADKVQYLSFLPALGYNDYDKLMAGIMVHNYGLPLSRFNFLVAPMLSTERKKLTGIARLQYTVRRPDYRLAFSLDGSRYAFNNYNIWVDAAGMTQPAGWMHLDRWVPAIRLTTFPEPGNFDKSWNFGAKAYILRKNEWGVTGELNTATETIGELKVSLQDKRALYPYGLSMQLDGTEDFLRAGLTGNYFLNYDAHQNGLRLRAFAGKFFYLKEKNTNSSFALRNAFLSLSGPSGAQDYTYSNYFVGRSAYEGWMSQQLVAGDGFFKVATPNLQDPVGLSDDWLAAVNLTSDIPEGINPFALLPFRLPVRVFMDLGTYAQSWSDNPSTGRFLYDAGLELSLFKESVTVYFPILYSKIYRDTYRSTGDGKYFSRTIRFSIDLAKLQPKVLQRIL